ncbi:MAG: GNAT family N-acetyltransferase [Desulfobacterium sp.]|nr:GNAT family N-acetyltransferase [Desulfobacterium sp.]
MSAICCAFSSPHALSVSVILLLILTCYVGKLAVLPDMQNQGIGAALMKEIEKHFTPKRFELFVGSKSNNNIHLYQKLGYNIYKTGSYECDHIEILYMEKINKNR